MWDGMWDVGCEMGDVDVGWIMGVKGRKGKWCVGSLDLLLAPKGKWWGASDDLAYDIYDMTSV